MNSVTSIHPRLSDTQRILLSTASQREGESVLPLPRSIAPGGGAAKAIAALTKRGLAEERATAELGARHRSDGDQHYGVFLTLAGAAAIGVEAAAANRDIVGEHEAGGHDGADPDAMTALPAAPGTRRPAKTDAVIALLTRADGATTAELIAATGWLPHTTRAALTGLRKKGHRIERTKRGTETCYRIVAAVAVTA